MFRLLAALLIVATTSAAGQLPAATTHQPDQQRAATLARPSVMAFLKAYAHDTMEVPDTAIHFALASAALGPHGTRALVVFVVGRWWCGSGGCTTMVLLPSGSSYRVMGDIPINHPPISVLPTTHYGWHDLAVIVQGGGIREPRRSIVRFDGKGYNDNPSLTPVAHARGRVLIRSYDEVSP